MSDNYPIVITARHLDLTDSLREFVETKLRTLHLEYPRIMEAKVVLDDQKHGFIAEIVLFCANNVTIEADTESRDMHEAIDKTIDKISRQMRKEKTRRLSKREDGSPQSG